MGYPSTTEQRKAGMAAFRAKLKATHERFAADQTLSDKEREYQRSLVDAITAAQKKHGEVA